VIFSLALTITASVLALAVVVTRPPGPVEDPRTLVRPLPSHGYAEGAPPGFSGGFTEQSCDACHFHAAPNSGAGRLAIEGVPDRFVAGEPYRVTILLTHPGMKLAGFQLTARFKDDGSQAGTLAKDSSSDAAVGIEAQSGIQYAGQRREGAAVVMPEGSLWTVIWTAPSATRTIVFHVAANAANGDERADGDYVYTMAREVEAGLQSRLSAGGRTGGQNVPYAGGRD
jgi:hypothetical protein